MSTLTADIRTAVERVVAEHFVDRLHDVYAGLQAELGLAGDISPWEDFVLEAAETNITAVVARWLVNGLSFDAAEAMGMDGTLRDG